jgi:YD repeat-containing protein
MASFRNAQRALRVLFATLSVALSATPAVAPPAFTEVTTLAAGPALQRPLGVAIDPASGNVYVADSRNHQIKAISETGVVTILAGSGVPGLADGVGNAAQFHEPTGIVFDPVSKVLYVADRQNHLIRRVTLSGVVTRVAGSGKRGFTNGDVTTAAFDQPAAIAIAADGSLLVADSANNVIRRIAGNSVTTIAGSGQSGNADGAVAAARFASPEGIAIRADGAVFVADSGNHRIRMIAADIVSTISGSVAGFADGSAATARFRDPHGLCFDEAGVLYVADTGNGTIRRIDMASSSVTTLTGAPERRNAPRPIDGNLATAALSDPFGITYAGALFVADARHDAVRVIEPQLILSSVSPGRGPRAGGTNVTITGSGFVPGAISVTFGSAAATGVQYHNATELVAATPAGSGPVDVTVSLRGRNASLGNAYTYSSPPTITSLSPLKGPMSGGQLVTIDGSELDVSTKVFFGGQAAASLIVESPTRLTVTTPASAAGVADVTVKTDSGEATRAGAYTFVAAPVISSFAPLAARGGSTVTIHGTSFDPVAAENEVRFAGAVAQVLSASPTDLVVVVPSGANSGRITVKTVGGLATSSADFTIVSVVSLTIAPQTVSVEVGETTQLRAMGRRSDGSQADVSADVTWSTTQTQIVALLSSGAVRGLTAGAATVKATLGTLEAAATVTVAPPTPLPPDPAIVAPRLDATVSAPLNETTAFLYSGPNAIQSGVAPNAIEDERAAVIRGRVLNRDGLALRGVRVSIRGHAELGWTLSRADGAFDLAVNGGGSLVVEYTKNRFLPAHRSVHAPWQSYGFAPDVVLVPLDETATRIVLNTPAAQVARGSAVTDDDGARQATLFVPAGTTGSMKMPDGTTRPLDAITVRATEYSVGDHGKASMPAPLPPSSGYTYCVELSADEALEAGATSVTFNSPLVFYVENFLNFPVGGIVPAGYYDRARAVWVPSANGRIIRILSVSGGVATIDGDGDNIADGPAALAALGVTPEEQSRLASLYTANTSLWRVPVPHFTPWDCNWPYGPPLDAQAPQNGQATGKDSKSNTPVKCAGSVIECENQTLGEGIAIEGTPFTLNYRSDRVEGRTTARQLSIPVSGSSVAGSLKRIQLTVSVEGKQWTTDLPATPNQTVGFTWDGRDAYNRPVSGATKATINITYTYPAIYQQPATFAESFGRLSGVPLSGSRQRAEIDLFQSSETRIEGIEKNSAGAIGGWSLSPHHAYNARAETLYLGTGDRRNGAAIATTIDRFAGQYNLYDESGDGGPALDAKLIFPWYVTAAPDGSVYIADAGTESLRRVDRDGIITHVAGNEASSGSLEHNGEPASGAKLNGPYNMAFGPDGSLYVNDDRRIHRIKDGLITTVAGKGTCCTSSGDGGPAREAGIGAYGIAVDANGVLYIADNDAIRKVENGIITSVTQPTCSGPFLSGPAPKACVWAYNIAIGPDGLLYGITSTAIWRITAGGMVQIVAGCASCSNVAADGSSALSGRVTSRTSWGFDIGPDGTFYFSDDLARSVRAVTPDGVINTIAGDGTRGFAGDGGPATAAQMFFPWGVSMGPNGTLYVSDSDWGVVRKLVRPFPSWSNVEHAVGSGDGEELYIFDPSGRHLRTIGRRRGDLRQQFSYDAAGELISVRDTSSGTTTIQRDAAGKPVAIIAPGGQRTELALDDDGYLKSVTNAARESHTMTYQGGGLLASLTNPRGKISTFAYDSGGALRQDSSAGLGTKTLARTVNDDTVNATLTSSLARTWRFFTERRKDKSIRSTTTSPAGLVTQMITGANGKSVRTAPDGTVITAVESGDPRFGMRAPISRELTFAQPSGLTSRLTTSRAVTLAVHDDPFSTVTETETYNLNGRISTATFDANAGTVTTRSPLGRQVTTRLDTAERITSLQVATFEPMSFSYSGGQLASVQSGNRSWTMGYDAAGRLTSTADPVGGSIEFTYDDAGRMQTQSMSGSRQIRYGWDANGNLQSLTTPNGAVHSFTYADADRMTSYAPPQGGLYQLAYNSDGQVRSITQPDTSMMTFGYDGAGRLETITGAQRQLSYSYLGTGRVGRITAPEGSLAFT